MNLPDSPFRLTYFVWESQPGRYALTAVAHAFARLQQGQDAYFGPPEDAPLGYDETQTLVARLNLIAPFKPRADVVVVGKAYSPPGLEVDRLVMRLRVGDFGKAVSITGDRLWTRDASRWGSSPPRPFGQMLLSPERAIRSAENPAGLDPAAIPVEGRLAMPNLEPAGGSFSAIVGPVPPSAPSRRNLLDAAGAYWVGNFESGRQAGPVPDGFNFQFFNVAPQDQQVASLLPGEAIVLENLHPAHPLFTTRLPLLVPRVVGVDGTTGQTFEVPTRCDTLWIDGDRETAWLVYRGSAALSRPDQPLSLRVEAQVQHKRADPPALSTSTMLQTQPGVPSPGTPFGGAPTSVAAYGMYGPSSAQGHRSWTGEYARPLNEITSDLPETPGSYPPPPPPRRITEEVELPAAAPSVAGLPFASAGGAPPTPTALALEATAPFTGTASTTLPPEAPAAPSSAAESLRTRMLVQRAAPGPIPDIGPTVQPVVVEPVAVGPDAAPPSVVAPPIVAPPPAPVVALAPPPVIAPPLVVAPASPPILAPPPAPVVVPPPVVAAPHVPSVKTQPVAVPASGSDTRKPAAVGLVRPQAAARPQPTALAPDSTSPSALSIPHAPAPAAPQDDPEPATSSAAADDPSPRREEPSRGAPPQAVPPPPPSIPRAPSIPPPPSIPRAPTAPPPPPSIPRAPTAPPSPPSVPRAPSVPKPPTIPSAPGATASSPVPAATPPAPVDEASAPDVVAPKVASFVDDPTPPAPEVTGGRDEHVDAVAPALKREISLEEAARARARLSLRDANKAAVLGKLGIEDSAWVELERQHLKAIDEAAQRGDTSVLERYDEAYLDELDRVRGHLDELGYARIQFARESGQLATTLEELLVSRNDLMRIDRTFRRRLASDKELAERYEDELERLRGGG